MRLDLAGRREIRAAKRRITDRLDAKGVLKGLSPAQTKRLIEQLWFADLHYKFREQLGPHERRVDRFFERGRGQLGRLRSQVGQLRAAFSNVRKQVASIEGDDTTPSGNVYLAEALHQRELPERLQEIATALEELELPPDEIFDRIPGHRTSAGDPAGWVTQWLADFFIGECELAKNDTSQRIARIGNALWRWNLREDDPGSHTPQRSSAIRKRLTRKRPANRR